MSEIVIVVERNGNATIGRLVYAYTYPHAIPGKDGQVLRFERRIQRCALLTASGELQHFTVPASLTRRSA